MSFVKTSALNAVAVLIRMLTLLGINKILAVLVGPSGYAIIGQFQNAIQMITTFSSGAIHMGVTKYTAQEVGNEKFLIRLWRTAGSLSIIGSLLSSALIFLFGRTLSSYFLKDPASSEVFNWFAGLLIFFVLNSILLAILNGKKEIKTYVAANIAGSFLSLVLTYALTLSLGLKGALIALGIYQSVSFFVTLFLILRKPWFQMGYLYGVIDGDLVRKLSHYTLMALASAACLPLAHVFLRNFLTTKLSLTAAGEWEAMFRLSSAYLMFVTSTLSVYFLPRISELKSGTEVREEIIKCLKLILPLLMASSFVIYLLRLTVIDVLFTLEFRTIEQLVGVHLIGDIFKVVGWMFGYVMIAKGLTREYILSEVIFSLSFLGLVHLLLPSLGLKATAYAHLMNYVAYVLYGYWRLVSNRTIL